MGFFFVQLKEWKERKTPELHSSGIVNALNQAFAKEMPEAVVVAFGPPAIPGLGTGAGFTMELQDRVGHTPAVAGRSRRRAFIEAARKRPEIGRISTLYRANVPQVYADIDRSKVLKVGVPIADVNTTLGALLGSSYVNDFNRFGRVYKVYVQAEPEFRTDPKQLGLFYRAQREGGHGAARHAWCRRGRRAAPSSPTGSTSTARRKSPACRPRGTARRRRMKALEEVAADRRCCRPTWATSGPTCRTRRSGRRRRGRPSPSRSCWCSSCSPRSTRAGSLPFSVLLGTPFAAFGAYFGLWAARHTSTSYVNNIFAQIGLIMLIGLAAKNAILIVEFAKMLHEQGKDVVTAALESARLRFRPILMTAFAFILGVTPLVRATGAGAEARKVMGMTVFAGMLIATILGVLLIPMLFVLVGKLTGSKPGPAPETGPPAHAPEGGGH